MHDIAQCIYITLKLLIDLCIKLTIFTDVPSKPPPPKNPTYEDCEMKNVVDMQHNPSYAVPSQVTGSTEKKETITMKGLERRGNENKMADKGGDIVTYETPS